MAALDEAPDQFEVQRKRAAAQNTAAVQGQQDALKRRFAALGSINSGAAIKQDQLVQQAGQENLSNANEQINAAQNAENRRIREVKEGRDFATSERLGSQDFAAQQAKYGQDFASHEAELGRGFSAAQNEAARAQAERLASQDLAFRQGVANSSNEQFKQNMDFANKQFEEEKATTDFNKRLADEEAHKKNGGILGSIFGDALPTGASGGYLGKGLDSYRGGMSGGAVLGPAGFVAGAANGAFSGGGGIF